MAFVPIQDSGLAYGFFGENGEEIVDSVIAVSANNLSAWSIFNIGAAINFRITIQSYEAVTGGAITDQAAFDWGSTGLQANQTEDGSGFTPSPVIGAITEADVLNGDDFIAYTGAHGSEGNPEETYSFLIEVELPEPEPYSCEEYGRATRAYVSGYNRSKVHVARIRRQERRCVVADFNGAIPPSRSIVLVTWRCVQPWVTKMVSAAIDGREATVLVDFQNPGFGAIKATVQLDNGEIYNQIFEFSVLDAPYFLEGTPVQGPYILTASA